MKKSIYPKALDELKRHIMGGQPSLYCCSRTSTVIPYDQLDKYTQSKALEVVDLSLMPKKMDLLADGFLVVRGAVTWRDAQDFCKSRGRTLLAWPTEMNASALAGIATSATGEKSFGNGPLHSHLRRLCYLNHEGHEVELRSDHAFELAGHEADLEAYQKSFRPFLNFKNGPFPRFERQLDLMLGTEGQLGVIIEAEFKTAPLVPFTYMFLKLPRWEMDPRPHIDLVEKVQKWRGQIQGCELLDANCLAFLDAEERPFNNADMVTLEIRTADFEMVHQQFLSQLMIAEEDMFEIEESKFQKIRVQVPQRIFETNSRKSISKKGTDIQVQVEKFSDLLELYKTASQLGVDYGLFGHIGDRHLHFNFMPTHEQQAKVDNFLADLYQKIVSWQISPFAEHGIGFLKRQFIRPYHQEIHHKVFHLLKAKHDPKNIFFPMGFMGES